MSTPRETPDAPSVTRSGERLPAPIHGVRYERLTVHADHRGQLVPAFDPAHPFWDEPIVWAYNWTLRQASRSFTAPPVRRIAPE